MSTPAYDDEHLGTAIPLAQAPTVAELARRARAHERIELTEVGADSVLVVSAPDERAALDWEAAFVAETVLGAARGGPYLPSDLVEALDAAPLDTAEAFLTALEARSGEDVPTGELWALWERMTAE